MRPWAPRALSLLAAVAVGFIWFVAASRFMYRLGPNDAAAAVGLLTGLAVGLTMWRWSASE